MPHRRCPPPQSREARAAPRTTDTSPEGRPVTKLHTIAEVADSLGISARSVRRLVASGALSAHRLGRLIRISDRDLATFLDANRSV